MEDERAALDGSTALLAYGMGALNPARYVTSEESVLTPPTPSIAGPRVTPTPTPTPTPTTSRIPSPYHPGVDSSRIWEKYLGEPIDVPDQAGALDAPTRVAATTAAATVMPFAYPDRMPSSRLVVTKLNRDLDDLLGEFRLTTPAPGQAAKSGSKLLARIDRAKTAASLPQSEPNSPTRTSTGAASLNATRQGRTLSVESTRGGSVVVPPMSSGSVGGGTIGGGMVGGSAGLLLPIASPRSEKFDTTLGGLLHQVRTTTTGDGPHRLCRTAHRTAPHLGRPHHPLLPPLAIEPPQDPTAGGISACRAGRRHRGGFEPQLLPLPDSLPPHHRPVSTHSATCYPPASDVTWSQS